MSFKHDSEEMHFLRSAPVYEWLIQGGDARLVLDKSGRNRYGCLPVPEPDLIALGSSTASGITPGGYAAAAQLHGRLLPALQRGEAERVFAEEWQHTRQALLRLLQLDDMSALELRFAASGTDAHRMAVAGMPSPSICLMVEAAESGRGVPAALASRGTDAAPSEPAAVIQVALRHADGNPRTADEIDADFTRHTEQALTQGRRVLLVLADVSKTGMIAPSLACAANLKQQHGIEVLVDACQFRMSTATLRGYLEHGFMVALTGSKFLSGPPFSGALLLPGRQSSLALGASVWPVAAQAGVLLRWEAALHELRAYAGIPHATVINILEQFFQVIHSRLEQEPAFAILSVPVLSRGPQAHLQWDSRQTLYPFLLKHPVSGRWLNRDETQRVYQLAQQDGSVEQDHDRGILKPMRVLLGQPVACGIKDDVAVSALRLSVSANMVAAAYKNGQINADGINQALSKVAHLTQAFKP